MSAYSQRSGFWGAEWFQSMKRENERERENGHEHGATPLTCGHQELPKRSE